MNTLDRLLLRRGVLALCAMLVLVLVLFLGIDLTLHIRHFAKAELGPDDSLAGLVARYGWFQIPKVMTPVLVLCSMAVVPIVLGPLLRRRLVMTLCSAGIGLRRIARPLVLLALLVGLLSALLQHLVAPASELGRQVLEDQMMGRTHKGRCWRDQHNGAVWFVKWADLEDPADPRLSGVLLVPDEQTLIRGDRLAWQDGGWELLGALRWRADAGAPERLARLRLDATLAPRLTPVALTRLLLDRRARNSFDLLAGGTRHDRIVVWQRCLAALAVPLAVIMVLLVFLRLDHADQLLRASVRALLWGGVPVLLLELGGYAMVSSPWPPGLTAGLAVAAAVLPLLWARWRRSCPVW